MARKRRDTSVSNSTKKAALSGRRVSRKTVIKNSEIEESIQKNRFLDFKIQQKYEITPVHQEFLDACFKDVFPCVPLTTGISNLRANFFASDLSPKIVKHFSNVSPFFFNRNS